MNSEGIEDYVRRKTIKTLKKKKIKERKKKHKRMCTVCIQLELSVSLLAHAMWQRWNRSGLRQGPAAGWWVPKEACVCTSAGHGKFNRNARRKLLCEMLSTYFLLLTFPLSAVTVYKAFQMFSSLHWFVWINQLNWFVKGNEWISKNYLIPGHTYLALMILHLCL